MVAFSVQKKSIGTAVGRDFATITLWEASFTTSNSVGHVGEVFADSDFDEHPIFSGTNRSDPANQPILVAAPGQRPVIKPTTNGDILKGGYNDTKIIGLTFDGINMTSGNGLRLTANRAIVVGCEARNCPGDGFLFDLAGSNSAGLALYCLSHNNTGQGFNSKSDGTILGCGVAKNGGIGISGSGVGQDVNVQFSWSLDNTGADYQDINKVTIRFCYASDTSMTDQGALTFSDDIFESQSSGSLGFTNFAANDFTLAVGSTLRLKGALFTHAFRRGGAAFLTDAQATVHDVFANRLQADIGARFDVGPHQPSLLAPTSIFRVRPVTSKFRVRP